MKFKRIPPILAPFYLTIAIPFWILKWLIGFKVCEDCERSYWLNEETWYYRTYQPGTNNTISQISLCEKCSHKDEYERHKRSK